MDADFIALMEIKELAKEIRPPVYRSMASGELVKPGEKTTLSDKVKDMDNYAQALIEQNYHTLKTAMSVTDPDGWAQWEKGVQEIVSRLPDDALKKLLETRGEFETYSTLARQEADRRGITIERKRAHSPEVMERVKGLLNAVSVEVYGSEVKGNMPFRDLQKRNNFDLFQEKLRSLIIAMTDYIS